MKEFSELLIEGAEEAGRGAEIEERKLSSRVKCLFFASGKQGEGCHTLVTEGTVVEDARLGAEMEGAIGSILSSMIGKGARKVLAVGLGNPSAVVDSLGCETVKRLETGERKRGYLAALLPSVYGMTGLESASIVKGVIREYMPDLVLTVDTLATRRAERLCRAVQISPMGIVPGGGVGNPRSALTEETLGVPVLSVGVPLLARADRCATLPAGLVVTPKEIDLLVPAFALLLSEGIERALGKQIG